MKRFVAKLFLYLSPLIVVTGVYFCTDPFKVLYHYNSYYDPQATIYYELDDDYVATQTLIQNNPANHYDSYIFGSSRSDNYMVGEFGRHVNSKNCYHFNSAYESLYGVERKMVFLDREKYKLDNALIIVDYELLKNVTNDKGQIRLKHPALSGQNSVAFQLEFLKDFFDKDFLFAYLDLKVSGHIKQYMVDKDVMKVMNFNYNNTANEIYWAKMERDIDNNKYYSASTHGFYTRDTVLRYGAPVIGTAQKELLNNMRSILLAHHTKYKIVISPLYDQLKLNTGDLKTLQDIFGNENVFDFSGINDITNDTHNYYETSHYRPKVCTEIMNVVYKG